MSAAGLLPSLHDTRKRNPARGFLLAEQGSLRRLFLAGLRLAAPSEWRVCRFDGEGRGTPACISGRMGCQVTSLNPKPSGDDRFV
jgi:hypothetical protein